MTISKGVHTNPSFDTITVEALSHNGNGCSSIGGHGGSGDNALTYSGNANGGTVGNGGSGKYSGYTSSSTGSGGQGGSAGLGSTSTFSGIQ